MVKYKDGRITWWLICRCGYDGKIMSRIEWYKEQQKKTEWRPKELNLNTEIRKSKMKKKQMHMVEKKNRREKNIENASAMTVENEWNKKRKKWNGDKKKVE